MDRSTADSERVVLELTTAAGLPPVRALRPLDSRAYGLDNRLTRGTLEDGREVLLRQNRVLLGSPRQRVDFLRSNGVPLPWLYVADDAGNSLWEFVPGQPVGDLVDHNAADDTLWRRVGGAFAAVHSVVFPAPLQGPIGLESLQLCPLDPVDQLRADIESARSWAAQHLPDTVSTLDQVATFVTAEATAIRAERPTLTHGDTNLLNIIADEDSVRLIDWDFPAVRYPIAELSALDEHAYLHGMEGLPPAFFQGYGRDVSAELLLAYRIVGCLGWLSGDDWAAWESDPTLPVQARDRLGRWHARLLRWAHNARKLAVRLA